MRFLKLPIAADAAWQKPYEVLSVQFTDEFHTSRNDSAGPLSLSSSRYGESA